MKDLLSTRTDQIKNGRDPLTMDDHLYADGDKKFITIGGIPFSDPVHKAGYVF
jgi:hypothetical protein